MATCVTLRMRNDTNHHMSTVADRAKVPSFFARYQPSIDRALRAELENYDSDICDTHRYHMGWADEEGVEIVATQGKRLRPTMTLLGADAVDGDPGCAMPVATALEFVHNFSLIHDDIEDRDKFRHHRPTVWVVWGDESAIVSGNSMLKIADRAARALVALGVNFGKSMQAQRSITEAYMRMIEGQFMDIDFEKHANVSVEAYLAMIERKTGALIETSLYLGALVGGNDDSNVSVSDGLRDAGYEFGRLFQIRDDVLGVWGSDETGKPVCGDIYNKKKSLPAIHALNASQGNSSTEIQAIYQKPQLDDRDVDRVLEIMMENGTYEYCNLMSARHWSAAAAIIDELDLNPRIRNDLFELGEYLVERIS